MQVLKGLRAHRRAGLLQVPVKEPKDMPFVKGNATPGQIRARCLDERGRHIHRHLTDYRWIRMRLEEALEGLSISAWLDKKRLVGIEIDEDGNVVVASACRGLIDTDALARGNRVALVGLLRVLVIDVLDALRIDAQRAGNRSEAMMQAHQVHHMGLKKQREAGVVPGKGHLEGLATFALFVLKDGHPGVQKTAVLKQLEMLPRAFVVAVEGVFCSGPIGFIDAEIDMDLTAGFVFFDPVDEEGGFKGQKRGEFVDDFHRVFGNQDKLLPSEII